jgi:hypothetical protein
MPDLSQYDVLDPRQMGPVPDAVQMPGGQPQKVAPPATPSQADIDKMMLQRTQNTEQLIGTIQKGDAERTKLLNEPAPRPPLPKFQDIPKPPQDDLKSVFQSKEGMAGLVFATVMGSMMSRRHGLGAMQAATGYMQGWKEGDKEKIEQNRQKWSDSVDQVIKQNQVEGDRYNAVWKNDSLSMADKQAKIQAIAASVGDATTIASLKNGDMDMAYKLQQDRSNAAMKLYEAQQKYTMGGNPQAVALRRYLDENPYAKAEDIQNFIQQGRPPRSATALAMQKYMQENPHASAKQIAEAGADNAAYAAAQRAMAVRGAQLGAASQELVSFAGPALAISELVPRGQWVPINELNLNVRRLQSDPNLRELSNRTAALVSAYAQVISRTGVPTVHAQERADKLVNQAESQEAYERGVDTLINEADLAEKAPDIIRERMKDQFEGKAATPAPKSNQGWGPLQVQ